MNIVNILIVDDEEDIITSFISCYSRNFNILSANSYDTAVEILERQDLEIGVIITDQRMPKKKGNDILKYASQKRPLAVCMLMTGYSDIGDTVDAVNASNVEYYIEKPWDIEELEERINQALKKYNKRKEEKTIVEKKAEWVESLIQRESFIANMAHEIRTPVIGVINLVNELLLSSLPKDEQKIAEDIQSASDYLLHFVNDLLDVVKIEANQFTIENREFDLKKLLYDTEKIIRPRLHEGVDLTVHADYKYQYIIGDDHRLQQILLNLVSNAAKFTHKGNIVISVSFDDLEKNKKRFLFKIIDSGIGISEEKIHHIFQPFTQSDSSVSRKYGGTGLGLNLVKSLVELQKGTLGVVSKENEGSTFWFSIDFATANHENINKLSTSTKLDDIQRLVRNMPFKRVLLAEDDITTQKIMKKIFNRIGIQYDVVENGNDLVQSFKNTRYDIVITDISMPIMSGLEASRIIREYEKENDQSKTRIVISSSNREEEMDVPSQYQVYDTIIPKPFKIDDFIKILGQWF